MYHSTHFYLVFNPLLNTPGNSEWTQAHEFFFLLRKCVEKGFSDHLYWGKLLIDQKQEKLDIPKFQAVVERNRKNRRNSHLYISDFNSLWVAKVEGVEGSISRAELTLPFYKGKDVEIWFKVSDMALIADNNLDTNEYLQKLVADPEFYGEGEAPPMLNPYLHHLRYPLVVEDTHDTDYFSQYGEKKLVVENDPQIFQRNSHKVTYNLHTYTIPREFFSRIPKMARNEIINSELEIFNQRVLWPVKVAKSYLHALELTLNDLFIWHLKKKVSDLDSLYVDLRSAGPRFIEKKESSAKGPREPREKDEKVLKLIDFHQGFTMENIILFVTLGTGSGHTGPGISIRKIFEDKPEFLNYLKGDFQETVKHYRLLEICKLPINESQEMNEMSISEAMTVRNLVLGVGCYGLINQLIAAYFNYEVGSIFKGGQKMKKEDNAI